MPKKTTPPEIENNTPALLFWMTSSQFMHAAKKLDSDHIPARYLVSHAIEMALKAHLRAKGYTLDELKDIGHSISTALNKAQASGMGVPPKRVQRVLDFIDDIHFKQEYRYPHLYHPKYITSKSLMVAGAWALHEAARAVAANQVSRSGRAALRTRMQASAKLLKHWATPRPAKKDPVLIRLQRLLANKSGG